MHRIQFVHLGCGTVDWFKSVVFELQNIRNNRRQEITQLSAFDCGRKICSFWTRLQRECFLWPALALCPSWKVVRCLFLRKKHLLSIWERLFASDCCSARIRRQSLNLFPCRSRWLQSKSSLTSPSVTRRQVASSLRYDALHPTFPLLLRNWNDFRFAEVSCPSSPFFGQKGKSKQLPAPKLLLRSGFGGRSWRIESSWRNRCSTFAKRLQIFALQFICRFSFARTVCCQMLHSRPRDRYCVKRNGNISLAS